jgi:membrane protein DedA with SNARE-associated domain
MLAYITIFVFAILEGEVYYIAMCVAATAGKLDPLGVVVAGALGGSAGDQFWFYLLRGRIHWLDRYPRLAKYRDVVINRVRARQTMMVLISRFLPGLRVAIPVACAYAGVRPVQFTVLNLISSFAWAASIMLVIAKLGPDALSAFGLRGWWGPIVPAVLVLLFFRWLGRPPRATQSSHR